MVVPQRLPEPFWRACSPTKAMSARWCRTPGIVALGLLMGFSYASVSMVRAGELADRPVKRSAPVTYQVDFRAVVTPRKGTKMLRVWLPLAQTDAFQTVGKRSLSTLPRPVEPVLGREPTFGNQFAYFEFADPTGAVMITHQFEATTSQFDWDVRLDEVETLDPVPASMSIYLRPDPREEAASELSSMTVHRVDAASGTPKKFSFDSFDTATD